MHSGIVATLSFDPGVEQQWRDVLFGGVKKDARSTRYSDVITNIANYQDAVQEESSTLIQRLGGGNWCMLNFRTVFSNIKHTIITGVRGFSSEMANQKIIEYADSRMRQILFDLQIDNEPLAGRPLTKFMFISGLIKMYDSGIIVCSADSTAAKRIIACLEDLLAQIDAGKMKSEDAMISFRGELQRMHKAAKRRKKAS